MAIRTRKSLNELANQFNGKFSTTLSNKEVFEKNLSAEWAKFEVYLDEHGVDDDGVPVAMTPVRTAMSIANDELLMQRLEHLATMSHRDAILDYLRTQCVKGWKIKQTADSITLDGDSSVYLDAYEVISTICSADLNGIIDACCIFADNVARYAISDCVSVSKNSMHNSYIELRKRKKWDMNKSQMSKTALAKQMTEICKFISCGVSPEMINADVTFVIHGIIQSKDAADSAGKFIKRDERTIVRYIFRAMYTRYNNKPYDFQDATRGEKGALSFKNNKAMSEPKEKKQEVPEAGNVTVTVAEKESK